MKMREYFDSGPEDEKMKKEAVEKTSKKVENDKFLENIILYGEDKDFSYKITNIIDNYIFKNKDHFSEGFLSLIVELNTLYYKKIEIQKLKSEYIDINLSNYNKDENTGFIEATNTRLHEPDYLTHYKPKKESDKELANKIMNNEYIIDKKITEILTSTKEKFPEEFDIFIDILNKNKKINSYN